MRDHAAQTAAEYARSAGPYPTIGREEALALRQASRALAAKHSAERAWRRYRQAAAIAAQGNDRDAIREQGLALYDVTDAQTHLRAIASQG